MLKNPTEIIKEENVEVSICQKESIVGGKLVASPVITFYRAYFQNGYAKSTKSFRLEDLNSLLIAIEKTQQSLQNSGADENE